MNNLKFVVIVILLAVSSVGMLSAQSTPAFVYSTEVTEMVGQTGQYSLTVSAVFSPRVGMQTKTLVLQKYFKQSPDIDGYWMDWLTPKVVTFGVGPNQPWTNGVEPFEPFNNLSSGVYRVSDGALTAVSVVGEPEYMPSLLANSYMRGYQLTPTGDLVITVDHRYHSPYILLWQNNGDKSAFVLDGTLPTNQMLSEFTVINTANLKANVTAVLLDTKTMTSTTTKINTRNPMVGVRK